MAKIEFDPGIRSGMPRLAGTRLTCNDIVVAFACWGTAQANEMWNLDSDAVRSVLKYCAQRACVDDQPTRFCVNCTLYEPGEEGEDDDPLDSWLLAQEVLKRDLQVGPDGVGSEHKVQSRPRALMRWQKNLQKEDEEKVV